jgi:hypothetical protein
VASGSNVTDRVRIEFFRLGSQYYIAGRYAVSAGLVPVAGNLLHHAIEMFLKGGLCAHTTEAERRRLGHELADNWSAFKTRLSATHLGKFDPVIDALDKFEDIRYPENIIQNGMGVIFQFGKTTPTAMSGQVATVPQYELFVGEIDALVKAIFDVSSVNPKAFVPTQPDGQTYLKRQNDETGLW